MSNFLDMSPIPLTTADAAPETGTATAAGPWIKNLGTPGGIQVVLSNTTTPTATVQVEYSNFNSSAQKGVILNDVLSLTAAGQGAGSILLNGYLYVRIRVTAISGTGAYVTGSLGVA